MKWRQPADQDVVELVLAVFAAPTSFVRSNLSQLTVAQWEKSYYWLDANGMALYLLDRLEKLNWPATIPSSVHARLQKNLEDSRLRVAWMFEEFTELNQLFQYAGLSYANLKGFTLAPDYCPRPELRCQLDFDFLLDGSDLQQCRELLEARGYIVRGSGRNVLEFRTDYSELAKIEDLYKPRQQRCLEVHFYCDAAGLPSRDPRLDRLEQRIMQGLLIPSLSAVDQFVGQAKHLFGHLCGANTRLAWLLEFAYKMRAHANDPQFWHSVEECAALESDAITALGTASVLSTQIFAPNQSLSMAGWVPANILQWVMTYGRRAVLADAPGTKLGLLLKNEMHRNDPAWQKQKRRSIVPLHRAPRLLPVVHGSWRKRFECELSQIRYELFRLRFHLVEGARYAYESFRFRRQLAQCFATKRSGTSLAEVHEGRS